MMSALEHFGAFIAAYRSDDRTCAKLRLHVADTIGAWIAATATEEGRALVRHRKIDARLESSI